MLTLLELFGAVFLFIWCGNAVPIPLFLALHPWPSSNYTCVVLFLAFVHHQQNRRRKVLNREALRLCRGAWHSKIWQKIHWFIVFHSSIWETRKFVWWGLGPPKPPVATELVSKETPISKSVLPNHANFIKMRATPFLSFFVEITFSVTANVSIPLNKGDFYGTGLTTGWLWFTLLAVQTYNLSSKLATQTHQLHHPLQERHFPTPLLHAEKQQLRWNCATLPLQDSFTSTAKIIWYMLEISRWTLKKIWDVPRKVFF